MNNNRRYLNFVLILAMTITDTTSKAQLFNDYREYPKPSVIFVKLPTYSKRLAIYEKAKNIKYAKQLKEDAVNMQHELIEDFNTNFKFCNYYFYYDTVQSLLDNRQFVGNVYDKNMKLVNEPPVQPDDTTYQFAYFGYYVTEFDNSEKSQKGRENTYYTGTQSQRLVLLNHKMNRIPDPVPNGTNYDDRYLVARFIYKWSSTYKSKLFDIYYTAYAYVLDLQLNNYYNRKNTK